MPIQFVGLVPTHPPSRLSQQALRVIGVTALAWGVKLPSAHAVARRAPHGYVPRRTLHRIERLALHPVCTPASHQPQLQSPARSGGFLAAVRHLHLAPVLAHSW